MTPLQALVLGVVQGLSEFLPISSSGHLILVPWLLGWPEHSLSFNAALHLGTALALLLYFWPEWLKLVGSFLAGLRAPAARQRPEWRLCILLLLGSIPAGLAGLLLESTVERLVRQPWLVALLLILFGVLLLAADRLGSKQRALADIGLADALAVGLAQVLALVPGVSRSGITITAGLLRGLDRPAAARFSFLLSTPITLAAALYSLRKAVGPGAAAGELGIFAIGVAGAAISGVLVIGFLLGFLQRHSLASFVWYRVVLGLAVLVLSALHGV